MAIVARTAVWPIRTQVTQAFRGHPQVPTGRIGVVVRLGQASLDDAGRMTRRRRDRFTSLEELNTRLAHTLLFRRRVGLTAVIRRVNEDTSTLELSVPGIGTVPSAAILEAVLDGFIGNRPLAVTRMLAVDHAV